MTDKRFRVVSVGPNGYRFIILSDASEALAFRTAWRLQLDASEQKSGTRYLAEEV